MQSESSKNTENGNILEKIKNHLPLISLALLILSTLNLMIYYDYFNIDILSYIDFTEVLQLQFRFFVKLVGIAFAAFLYLVLGGHSPKTIYEMDLARAEQLKKREAIIKESIKIDNQSEMTKSGFPFVLKIFLIICFIAVPIVTISYFFITIDKTQGIFWLYVLSVPVFDAMILFAYLRIRESEMIGITEEAPNKPDFTYLTISALTVSFIFTICIITRLSARSELIGSSNSEVTAILKDKLLITNNNYRYIGKTKNFTFFYDKNKKQAEIFLNTEISNMHIRNGIQYKKQEGKGFLLNDDFSIYIRKHLN